LQSIASTDPSIIGSVVLFQGPKADCEHPNPFSHAAAHEVLMAAQTEEITIRVDSEAARAYRAASKDEQRKLDLLLCLRLHDALRPSASLSELMEDIGRKAQERGLTPEILESLLHGE
jgi:hypothetical protein